MTSWGGLEDVRVRQEWMGAKSGIGEGWPVSSSRTGLTICGMEGAVDGWLRNHLGCKATKSE